MAEWGFRRKPTHFDQNQEPLCSHVHERANKNVHFKEHLSIKDSKASGEKQYGGIMMMQPIHLQTNVKAYKGKLYTAFGVLLYLNSFP